MDNSFNNMKSQEKMMKKMRDLALNHPEKISIIEISVDPNIQIEFFEILQKIKKKNNYNFGIEDYINEISKNNTSIQRKKEILAILVSFGEVESFRFIEDYLKVAEKELKIWTFLAYQQARLFLEAKLLEESKIYIASGLGGKEHRLRYSVAFYSISQNIFNNYQKKIINGEFDYYLNKNDSVLEDIVFYKNYVVISCLVPIYLELVDLLKEILYEINQYGNFIHPNLFITNEKKIEIKDIEKMKSETDIKV